MFLRIPQVSTLPGFFGSEQGERDSRRRIILECLKHIQPVGIFAFYYFIIEAHAGFLTGYVGFGYAARFRFEFVLNCGEFGVQAAFFSHV